ncbi:MAG: hypothetical protein HY078_12605 [Elusimicrobia bacterium]|nr:hypothetical protein [Elusimicrobiota bacterium]
MEHQRAGIQRHPFLLLDGAVRQSPHPVRGQEFSTVPIIRHTASGRVAYHNELVNALKIANGIVSQPQPN